VSLKNSGSLDLENIISLDKHKDLENTTNIYLHSYIKGLILAASVWNLKLIIPSHYFVAVLGVVLKFT